MCVCVVCSGVSLDVCVLGKFKRRLDKRASVYQWIVSVGYKWSSSNTRNAVYLTNHPFPTRYMLFVLPKPSLHEGKKGLWRRRSARDGPELFLMR